MLKPKKRVYRRKEIKQDKLVTYYMKSLTIFETYKKQIMYGLMALLAIVAISAYSYNRSQTKEHRASVEIARAKQAFDSGNYDEAISVLGPLTSQFSGTRSAGFGTILLAKSFLELEQYAEAERYFRSYLDDYGDDRILVIAAHSGLASCLEQQGKFEEAAAAYEAAAAADKASFRAPDLLYSAARCYASAGKPAKAVRVLSTLIENYPKSTLISTAKLKLAELNS